MKQGMFLGVCLSFFLVSCGTAPDTNSELKIVNGKIAEEGQFPAVIKLNQSDPSNGSSWSCSAAFVSPSVAISAGHCIELHLDNLEIGGHQAKKWYRPSSYDSQWWNYDFVLIDMGKDVAKDFLPIATEAPEKGDKLTIVGFGKTDYYTTKPFGEKRYGYNTVSQVYDGRISFTGPDLVSSPANLNNALNASGDSGGPLIVNGAIAGVSSSVSVSPQGEDRTGNYTNLNFDPLKKFISSKANSLNLDIRYK